MPTLQAALGADRGLFYLLAGLTVVPTAVARYRTQGIDDPTIRDTLQQFRCFCNNHRVGNAGLPGLISRQMGWLRHYRDGVLYRFGRLEFKLGKVHLFGLMLRRKSDGVKVLLAKNSQRFDRHGYIEYDNCPDEHYWTAVLEETSDCIKGCLIHPAGYADKRVMDFPLDQWEVLARPNDSMLDVHIPSGGGLSPEACRASFTAAAEFFTRRFPSAAPRLFWCHSWISNTQLEEQMPDSNLVALQRELYLFPVKSSGDDGLSFVFWCVPENRAEMPRDTRLQKALLDILDSGRKLRASGMILAAEDLEHYGTQVYRRNYSSVAPGRELSPAGDPLLIENEPK